MSVGYTHLIEKSLRQVHGMQQAVKDIDIIWQQAAIPFSIK